jgi:hypothetical protein
MNGIHDWLTDSVGWVTGFGVTGFGVTGFVVQGSGFRGSGVQGSGFMVQGSGFRVQGSSSIRACTAQAASSFHHGH